MTWNHYGAMGGAWIGRGEGRFRGGICGTSRKFIRQSKGWHMQHRISLDVLKVQNPCPADWSEMSGDDRSRFCQHCQKPVHDLSQMTLSDAERLVCQAAGSLCVRMHIDDAGKLITLDYEPAVRSRWTWKILAPL